MAAIDSSNHKPLLTFATHPLFVESRNDHDEFAVDRFMNLEELKENFPPLHGESYTVEDASKFAFATSMDYFARQFPEFFKSKMNYFRKWSYTGLSSIFSLRLRSLFIFFKYYLHDQSPKRSDFMDYAHVSYSPYCDVFVTERNVCNVLNHIKKHDDILANTSIIHTSEFLDQLRG